MYLLYQFRMNLDIEAVRTTVIPSLQCLHTESVVSPQCCCLTVKLDLEA